MYVIVWQGLQGSWLFYADVFMYICMYVCHCLTRSPRNFFVEQWFLMQVNGIKGFLVYEESSGNSSPDRSMRLVSCGYKLIFFVCAMPMFMPWQVTLRDTSTEWKQCDLWHTGTSMYCRKTLEARFLGRVSVWSLDEKYYCCIHVVHVGYVVLCTYSVVCVLYVQYCVHIVLCACCICGTMYI